MHVDEELGPLEVSRSDAHVVLLPWVVEFCESPIDQTQLTVGMVNHDVMRLNISVHNALRVTEVKSLQDFKHVEANVKVVEALVELAEVRIACVDKLSDNRGSLSQWVSHDVDEVDDIRASLERLQNLDLTSDLVLLNYIHIIRRL